MKWKIILAVTIFVLGSVAGYGISFVFSKYRTINEMDFPIAELSPLDYPDDPAPLSTFYQRYANRRLHLVKTGDHTFDFTFLSDDSHVATIKLANIDLSLFIPLVPAWLKEDTAMEKIAIVEREWNRQQVSFSPSSAQLTLIGGDGFEQDNLISCELARNCLNAGLWEILLFNNQDGKKVVYYHGWFEFPLGHYKDVFENTNHLSYWRHWYRLEHWSSPDGNKVDLEKLRTVNETLPLKTIDLSNERVIARGEQYNKLRTLTAKGVLNWGDFLSKRENVAFAMFLPPGRYEVSSRWGNEYERIDTLETATLRRIKCPACETPLYEIECTYPQDKLFIGGFDLSKIPTYPVEEYNKGYQMPMGISVPPVFQTYEELQASPPTESPYYSFLINSQNGWIDHHKAAIDGVIMHKDADSPEILHFYLLSYERHTLIAHYKFHLPAL